jgi:hypothetical protein
MQCLYAVVAAVVWWSPPDGPAAAQVCTRLNERLGLSDHLMVLNVMLAKIATNLKAFGTCEDCVEQTLNLFQVRWIGGYIAPKALVEPARASSLWPPAVEVASALGYGQPTARPAPELLACLGTPCDALWILGIKP